MIRTVYCQPCGRTHVMQAWEIPAAIRPGWSEIAKLAAFVLFATGIGIPFVGQFMRAVAGV